MSNLIILFEGFTIKGDYLPDKADICIPPSSDIIKNWKEISETLNQPFILIAVSLGVDMMLKANAHLHPLCKKCIGFGARLHFPEHEIKLVKRYILKDYTSYIRHFHTNCFHQEVPKGWSKYTNQIIAEYTESTLLQELELVSNVSIPINKLNHPNISLIHGEKDKIAPLAEFEISETTLNIKCQSSEGHLDSFANFWKSHHLEELRQEK